LRSRNKRAMSFGERIVLLSQLQLNTDNAKNDKMAVVLTKLKVDMHSSIDIDELEDSTLETLRKISRESSATKHVPSKELKAEFFSKGFDEMETRLQNDKEPFRHIKIGELVPENALQRTPNYGFLISHMTGSTINNLEQVFENYNKKYEETMTLALIKENAENPAKSDLVEMLVKTKRPDLRTTSDTEEEVDLLDYDEDTLDKIKQIFEYSGEEAKRVLGEKTQNTSEAVQQQLVPPSPLHQITPRSAFSTPAHQSSSSSSSSASSPLFLEESPPDDVTEKQQIITELQKLLEKDYARFDVVARYVRRVLGKDANYFGQTEDDDNYETAIMNESSSEMRTMLSRFLDFPKEMTDAEKQQIEKALGTASDTTWKGVLSVDTFSYPKKVHDRSNILSRLGRRLFDDVTLRIFQELLNLKPSTSLHPSPAYSSSSPSFTSPSPQRLKLASPPYEGQKPVQVTTPLPAVSQTSTPTLALKTKKYPSLGEKEIVLDNLENLAQTVYFDGLRSFMKMKEGSKPYGQTPQYFSLATYRGDIAGNHFSIETFHQLKDYLLVWAKVTDSDKAALRHDYAVAEPHTQRTLFNLIKVEIPSAQATMLYDELRYFDQVTNNVILCLMQQTVAKQLMIDRFARAHLDNASANVKAGIHQIIAANHETSSESLVLSDVFPKLSLRTLNEINVFLANSKPLNNHELYGLGNDIRRANERQIRDIRGMFKEWGFTDIQFYEGENMPTSGYMLAQSSVIRPTLKPDNTIKGIMIHELTINTQKYPVAFIRLIDHIVNKSQL
jgi:hypothetical protein